MTNDTDVFSAPDRTKPKGTVEFDHLGRYKLPDPITGKQRSWTRVSTIAHTISDTYHLDMWDKRMIAKGMGIRPDLAMLAANLDVTDDKEKLQKLAAQAKEAAGGSVGANAGTALHGYAERVDGGEVIDPKTMSAATKRSLEIYRATLQENDIETDPSMIERVVLLRELEICGQLDRVWTSRYWELPRIGDLKTQRTFDFGVLEVAIQTGLYANADYMWNEETAEWEPFPEMDKRSAIIAHLPVGENTCDLIDIPIDWGWACAKLALHVRDLRKEGKRRGKPYVNDGRWRALIDMATSLEDLSNVWRAARAEGEWSKALEQLGKQKLEQLRGTTEGNAP